MPQTVIFTTGTSVFRGLERAGVSTSEPAMVARITSQMAASLTDQVSVELATLAALKVTADDHVLFLSTESNQARLAGKLNGRIAALRFGCAVGDRLVAGVVLDDARTFRRSGLPNLVTALDQEIAAARAQGHDVTISVGAGIKALVPYLSIYAMLRQVTLCYLFQAPEALLRLPRLPVAFDAEALTRAARVLEEIGDRTAMPRRELVGRLGDDFARLEGLFDDSGQGEMTLSGFGFLVLEDLKQAESGSVWLSPSARAALGRSEGIAREQLEFMLKRCRDPLWRHQKQHERFEGSDLDPYKPGNTGQRLAGWLEAPNTMYVAELYADHDTYEKHLPGRRRKDYPKATFEEWRAPADDFPSSEEIAGDELLRAAQRRDRDAAEAIASAHAELERALALAAETEADAATRLAAASATHAADVQQYRDDLAAAQLDNATLRDQRAAFLNRPLASRLLLAWRGRLEV